MDASRPTGDGRRGRTELGEREDGNWGKRIMIGLIAMPPLELLFNSLSRASISQELEPVLSPVEGLLLEP